MKILALETSAKAVSAAVTEDGKVLCSGYQDTGLTHSRTLMPIVEGILKNTGLTVRDCDAIAVAVGPGSFTGIRIGVAAAKGLAFAADKPAVAVSTLEAMARNVSHMEGLIICAMDARRNQVYNALFRSDGTGTPRRLTEDRAISLPDLAEEVAAMEGPRIVLGDGASSVPEGSGGTGNPLPSGAAPTGHAKRRLRSSVRRGSRPQRRSDRPPGPGPGLSAAAPGSAPAGPPIIHVFNFFEIKEHTYERESTCNGPPSGGTQADHPAG